MEPNSPDPQAFTHVRMLIGVVTGLSVTRLITGLARFVQNPERSKISTIHAMWVLFMLLFVIHFWWFQFGLSHVVRWSFERYFFVITYAAMIFFTSSLLFPDQMDHDGGFFGYFQSRKRWFYGLLAALFIVDMIDTALKGSAHFHSFGSIYPLRQISLCVLAMIGMFVSHIRYHQVFAMIALLVQVWWIQSRFEFLH